MPVSLRDRVAVTLDGHDSKLGTFVNGLIFAVIIVSVVAMVLETEPSVDRVFGAKFDIIEHVSLYLFTVELLIRFWCAPSLAGPYGARRHPRIAYLLSPSGLIDLISVVPYYLGRADLIVFRSLRLLRIFRLLKLTRKARAMELLWKAFRNRRDELLSLGIVIALSLLISATVMYTAEHEAQPQHFGSIPQSFWWSVATLTTVGDGDYHPITFAGRFSAAIIMLACLALVSLPTAILGSAMYEMATAKKCPFCGSPPDGDSGPVSLRTTASSEHDHPS